MEVAIAVASTAAKAIVPIALAPSAIVIVTTAIVTAARGAGLLSTAQLRCAGPTTGQRPVHLHQQLLCFCFSTTTTIATATNYCKAPAAKLQVLGRH